MESNSELKYIFSNINELLKFAEAKNGGLMVLNTALVIGILSSYIGIQNFIFKPVILIGIICFGISVFLIIVSQFPITHNIFYNKNEVENTNLYFFEHLSHLDEETFINKFKKADNNFNPSNFDIDLINQILVNARITNTKFDFFKFASYFTAFGSGLIGLSSIIKIIWHF